MGPDRLPCALSRLPAALSWVCCTSCLPSPPGREREEKATNSCLRASEGQAVKLFLFCTMSQGHTTDRVTCLMILRIKQKSVDNLYAQTLHYYALGRRV